MSLLTLPRIEKGVGQVRVPSAAALVGEAGALRLARRLAEQMRSRPGVEPLTPVRPAVPALRKQPAGSARSCSTQSVQEALRWVRALQARGWLDEGQLAGVQDAEALFRLLADALRAQTARWVGQVMACLPEGTEIEQALAVHVTALQNIHAGLLEGSALPDTARHQLIVEVCGPQLIVTPLGEDVRDRVWRGAWDRLARAVDYEGMDTVHDGLHLAHPMIEEVISDALVRSRVQDGVRVYEPDIEEAFLHELGWEMTDSETRKWVDARVEQFAQRRARAKYRAGLGPGARIAKAWLAEAPAREVAALRAMERLGALARKYPAPHSPDVECDGLLGPRVALIEECPGFESELQELDMALSGETQDAVYTYSSLDQLLDALPRVTVSTAIANAAYSLILERVRND